MSHERCCSRAHPLLIPPFEGVFFSKEDPSKDAAVKLPITGPDQPKAHPTAGGMRVLVRKESQVRVGQGSRRLLTDYPPKTVAVFADARTCIRSLGPEQLRITRVSSKREPIVSQLSDWSLHKRSNPKPPKRAIHSFLLRNRATRTVRTASSNVATDPIDAKNTPAPLAEDRAMPVDRNKQARKARPAQDKIN